MKKKLTRGGGAPMILALIATVLGALASFQEYLGRFVYNLAFDGDTDKVFVSDVIGYFTMERNSVNVISLYTEKAFILTLVALTAFITFAAAAKKRKLVAGQAWALIITSAACCIEPVLYMNYFFSNKLTEGFSDSNDGVRFRTFYGFLIYALPIVIAVLLSIAALIVLIRLTKEVGVDVSGETAPADTSYQSRIIAPASETPAEMPRAVAPTNYEEILAQPAAQQMPEEVAEQMPAAETVSETGAEDAAVEAIIPEAPSVTYCASCGQQLDPAAKFCNNCGAKR